MNVFTSDDEFSFSKFGEKFFSSWMLTGLRDLFQVLSCYIFYAGNLEIDG